MNTTQTLIESFLNGNIIETKAKLARRSHGALRYEYGELTGCDDDKATAFADYIKGDVSFQAYCDSNHQPA
jgi:hypothetical protein